MALNHQLRKPNLMISEKMPDTSNEKIASLDLLAKPEENDGLMTTPKYNQKSTSLPPIMKVQLSILTKKPILALRAQIWTNND